MFVLLALCVIKVPNCALSLTLWRLRTWIFWLCPSVVCLATESPPFVVLPSCTQGLHPHISMVWLSSSALGQGMLGRLLAVSFSLRLSGLWKFAYSATCCTWLSCLFMLLPTHLPLLPKLLVPLRLSMTNCSHTYLCPVLWYAGHNGWLQHTCGFWQLLLELNPGSARHWRV